MILRWLLNHFLFAGTSFFAAGAVTTSGAAPVSAPPTGGTDTSGSPTTGGSEGQGGAVIPSAESGAEHLDTSTEDDGFGDFGDFGEVAEELQASSPEEFGPENYQVIKQALKDKPEVFKSVKKAVSMVKRFQEHFETPEKAGELLSDIQTLGGWDTVKQEMGETATFVNGWNAGDANVVKGWLGENGDGLTKNMPTILEHWRSVDQDGWAHDAALTFMATMMASDETGMSPMLALTKLSEMDGVKDSLELKTLLQRIQGIQSRAKQAPQQVQAKPDDSKLTKREQEVALKETEIRRTALAGEAQPILQTSAKNALKLVAGNKKLTSQQESFLLKNIHNQFAQLMKKDPEGIRKRQALLTAGQKDQWMKMVKAAAERTMPLAARRAWREYAGISGMSTQEKQERKAEGQQRRESGTSGTTASMEKKSPGDGKSVDRAAMAAKFGGRDGADNAFLWGAKDHGGKRVWIEKGTGKLYWY